MTTDSGAMSTLAAQDLNNEPTWCHYSRPLSRPSQTYDDGGGDFFEFGAGLSAQPKTPAIQPNPDAAQSDTTAAQFKKVN